MRILKYFFLLIFLFLIGIGVFVSTQKGDFDVTRSKVIKNPRITVFNYINDYRNWETFCSWIKNDNSYKFNYPELTMGQGASCTWVSSGSNGNLKTILIKENESITQKMVNNKEYSEIYWNFKDTVGGTKVTWRSKGKLDFKAKIAAFFHGGINSVIGDAYEKSLENLNKTLDFEINTYKVKVNGVVNLPGGFYLKQFLHCKQKDVDRNIKILVSRMQHFFAKNKMNSKGKPFIIYHKYDRTNDDIGFSVCMPVRDSIHIMPGSDIEFGKLASYTSLKTTLTGDYSHTQTAWKKAFAYLSKNHFERNNSGQIIEIYAIGRNDIKNPSKWVTEIYIPIFPKGVEKFSRKKSIDSLSVASPANETVEP
jgi:effector-binding domain-containing protein